MTSVILKRVVASCVAICGLVFTDADAAPGDVYSGGLSQTAVYRFTPQGSKSTFVSGPFADSLAFDSFGDLFIADTRAQSIVRVSPAGTVSTFATNIDVTALAFDRQGNLLVGDMTTDSILKYTPAALRSTLVAGVASPAGLAVDTAGNVFVSRLEQTRS